MPAQTVTLTSNDTLTLNGRVFANFADGDNAALTFDADRVTSKTGKNSNTIFAKNNQGDNAMLSIRLLRGSADDRFMQTLLSQSNNDFVSTQLLNGSFIKRLGDGAGNVTSDTYTLSGGMIVRNPDGKENADGDTDQGVVVYQARFANVSRTLA